MEAQACLLVNQPIRFVLTLLAVLVELLFMFSDQCLYGNKSQNSAVQHITRLCLFWKFGLNHSIHMGLLFMISSWTLSRW